MKSFRAFIFISVVFTFFSCEEILFEEDITNHYVVILAPVENTTLNSSPVSFYWEKVNGASSYEIQVATPDFENAHSIVVNTIVEENAFTEELNPGNYEWRLRALNSNYNTPFSSAKFTVEDNSNFSSGSVALVSPPNGYITNSSTLTLDWQDVPNADLYRVQILMDGILIKETTSTLSTVNLNFPEGDLKWRIRAENQTEHTLFSERNLLVDKTDPNLPIPVKPENGAELSNPNISFEWSRDDLPGSLEGDSLYVYKNSALTDFVTKNKVSGRLFQKDLEPQEKYFWFLKSFDEAGNQSNRSAVFSFKIN